MSREFPEDTRSASLKKILGYAALATLIVGLFFVWLLLRKPFLPTTEASAEAATSFNEKLARLTAAHELGVPAEVHLSAAEINSQIQQWLKANPAPTRAATLKNGFVHLEGSRLVSVLTLDVKGLDVYLTVDGHLSFANHAVRLIPGEVRLGSVPVPISWIEGKIDMHMELPADVTAMRVEKGELVVETQ